MTVNFHEIYIKVFYMDLFTFLVTNLVCVSFYQYGYLNVAYQFSRCQRGQLRAVWMRPRGWHLKWWIMGYMNPNIPKLKLKIPNFWGTKPFIVALLSIRYLLFIWKLKPTLVHMQRPIYVKGNIIGCQEWWCSTSNQVLGIWHNNLT